MGASALYHLTELGCTDAVLIERETLASGSTSKAVGGIRAQFSDELNIRIGQECIRRYERFHEQPGGEIELKQWGYLFLLTPACDRAAFESGLELQQSLGVPSEWLTPEDAQEIVPGLAIDDLIGATFSPKDGWATPEACVQGYAGAAARAGAEIAQSCPAERIVVEGGRCVAVETAEGRVATERVILTAGVWTRELGETAGVEIPVEGERRHVWFTEPARSLPERVPLTIDFASGFYFHGEAQGLLFGGREQTIDELAPIAANRLPMMEELGVRTGWSGLYDNSPDHNGIVGRFDDPTGLAFATGFSGHGFQQGPVVGEHLAELALDVEPSFDLSGFALERFAEGGTRPELAIV